MAMEPFPSGGLRNRRIQFMLRTNGILEASLPLRDGHALAAYLSSRRGSVKLLEATWVERGLRAEEVTLQDNEILWARPLHGDVPLINFRPAVRDYVPVEVVLVGGQVLCGELPLAPGQSVSDFLGTVGPYPILWSVRMRGEERTLEGVVLSQRAIQTVREVGSAAAQPAWERAADPAPVHAEVHWLVAAARQLDLPNTSALVLPSSASAVRVWAAVCAATGLSEEDLAEKIARKLRLPIANPDDATHDAVERVPNQLVERYGVRAMSDDGRTLLIATADPMNMEAEQALAFACKRRIRFALATPSALNLVIDATEADVELETLLAGMPVSTDDTVRVEHDVETQDVLPDDVSAEPIIRLANLVMREAVRQNASDIHLEPDQNRGLIRMRVDGVLRPFMHVPLAALHRVISRYKILGRMDIADRLRPQDGRVRVRIEGRRYELRLSTVPTQESEKAVIRIAGAVQEQTLDQLSMPAPELAGIRQLMSCRDGIIIVTGPTGSGKTTTLYGALHELNTGRINIMTVEDPVERELAGVAQIEVQPRRGVTFASSLRAILRQDPDCIFVGEIRDLETAEIAVQAAMTGHLVLTTLHTTSAVGVVERLRDLGLDRTALAASLRGVVAQRLARRLCTACEGDGCIHCADSGYRGRIPLMEVLTVGPGMAELIGRGALSHELQASAVADGMRTMRDVAAERIAEGLTTEDEVHRVLGEREPESAARGLGAGAPSHLLPGESATPAALLPAPAADAHGNGNGSSGALPARLEDVRDAEDSPARRRLHISRALLQGLDRCVAEGQRAEEVLHFACEQLAAAFDSPLVWIATMDEGALTIQARAGYCAPYLRDIVPDFDDPDAAEGAVATALRTGTPQARQLDQEPGFDSWREHARAHGLPVFLAVPMESGSGALGVVGLHTRSADGLDRVAGQELVTLVDRITGVLQRLRQLHAIGLQLSALEHAADSVFTTDRRGAILWVNRSFSQLTGYTTAEVIGQTPRMLRSDRQDAGFFRDMWDTILAGRVWRGELYNQRKDGSICAVEQTITPVTGDRGEVTHFLAVQRDITERKQREQSVLQLVTRDALTGLPNARALDSHLTRTVAAVAAGQAESALLLLHAESAAILRDATPDVADATIVQLAGVLGATLRPGDYLARLGDDEFAAILADTQPDGAVIAADRLRGAIARHSYDLPSGTVPPTVSIGIAPVDGTQGARAVLAMADSALYGGRDRRDGAVISTSTDDDAAATAEWAKRIRDALRDDHFFLYFQPVVRLDTRRIAHYDVLLRLNDDDGEVIPARVFIGHAERLGLMPQIDRWVVENVLRLMQTSPDLRVSINLGASTITSSSFRQFLQRQNRRMNAVGGRIIFEVAEVGVAAHLPRMLEHMTRLGELGCRFALDNFGVGAASVASLGVLPVDYVKLDGSLVQGLDTEEDRRDIVRALVTVARSLGKEVMAGWAERESTVQALAALGIELAQGHYLGAPAPELHADAQPEQDSVGDAAFDAANRWKPRLAV